MTAAQLQPSGDRLQGPEHSRDERRQQPVGYAFHELDAFAATLSHDLREPLRGIQYYAGMLSPALPPDQVQDIADRITRLADKMQTLTDSLLHYAAVGSQDLDWEECELAELVEEALDLLQVLLREKGVEVRVRSPLPKALTHPPFLVEILCNLISNAAKYASQESAYVEISAFEKAGGELQIQIKDNGIGIHADDHERIFQMLERLPGAEKYGSGAGMGLSITRRLLTRLSGTITVASSLGQGSCFTVSLPRVDIKAVL